MSNGIRRVGVQSSSNYCARYPYKAAAIIANANRFFHTEAWKTIYPFPIHPQFTVRE